MSKKYINADALLNHLYSHQDEHPDIAKVIAEFDAADVVEVVRCKDCKYYTDKLSLSTVTHGSIPKLCIVLEVTGFEDVDDDFCSRAERRTDE